MFHRATTLTGATDIDAAVQFLKEKALPVTRSQTGYRGAAASVDRQAGVLGILTMWDSAAHRDASESAVAKRRDEASQLFSGTMTIELFEEIGLVMAKPPAVGASLRVVSYRMDPAAVDDVAAYFTADVVPRIEAMAGFRGLRMMVNRDTGAGMVGTSWDDDPAMRQADGQLRSLREEVGRHGVTFGETSQRKIVLVDLP